MVWVRPEGRHRAQVALLGQRQAIEAHAERGGRHVDGIAGGGGIERPDEGKGEEALGIGLLATHLAWQRRQARANQHHRHLLLGAAVQGRHQRRQLFLRHALQLVDEEHEGGAVGLRGAAR